MIKGSGQLWSLVERNHLYLPLLRSYSAVKVLGIESTCDDTCASVVTSERRILSDVRFSQLELHVSRGGIVPVTARSKHAMAINGVVKAALDQANCSISDIDAVAVSFKPGLILSLEIGVDYARRLCLKYNKPLIGIHHMAAHALTAHLSDSEIGFPFLGLLISGGHTMLTLVKDIEEFYLLSESNNAPVGEYMDKKARSLKIRNLGHPFDSVAGGRAIEMLAKLGDPHKYPGPKCGRANEFNFSITSLKGNWDALLREIKGKHPDLPVDCPLPETPDLAASLQCSIVAHLGSRINRIVKYLEATDLINRVNKDNYQSLTIRDLKFEVDYVDPKPIKTKLVISGGVGCNNYIVDKLKKYCDQMDTFYEETKIEVVAPSPRHLCTDNGVMIAWNGVLKLIDDENNSNRGEERDSDNKFRGNRYVLSGEKEIMSLKAEFEAQLGVDIRKLIDTSGLTIKSLQV